MKKLKLIILPLSVFLISGASTQSPVRAKEWKLFNNPVRQTILLGQTTKKQYSGVEAELISIAEATLQTENDTLVTGDSVSTLKRNPNAQKVQKVRQAKFEKRLEKAKNRRSMMAKASQAYTSHQTKLDVNDIQVQADTATLTAMEIGILPLSVNGKPTEDAYSYNQGHRFTFKKENSNWVLSSDERLNSNEDAAVDAPSGSQPQDSTLPPPLPAPSDPPSKPVSLNHNLETQLLASASLKRLGVNFVDGHFNLLHPFTLQGKMAPLRQKTLLAQVGVSKQEIVNYAHLYAGPGSEAYDSHCQCYRSYNSSYRNFSGVGGDCTNFVSQALRQSGWKDVFNSPFDALSQASRADTSLWWYNSVAQSYTWTGAPQLFEFLKSSNGSRRATREFDLSKLEPGDVIQVDFAGDAYGITHSLIVTHKIPIATKGITGSNLLRIAYHTNNTLDRSFDDFYGQSPGAVYYAWKISSSY
jgi:Putative amidase domain